MLKNSLRGFFSHGLSGAAPSRPHKSLGFSNLVIWHPFHGVHRRLLFSSLLMTGGAQSIVSVPQTQHVVIRYFGVRAPSP